MNLSKSKLLSWRQCPKRLWLEQHRPELAQASAATQATFAGGHRIGEIARGLYGPGELLFAQETRDYAGALKKTRARLATNKPHTLFEAAFSADRVFVMADVLRATATGATVIEVKSSSKVKDYHVEDCATQRHVIEKSGLKVRRLRLAHVDTRFVYPGDGDYRGLLTETDLMPQTEPLRELVPRWIAGALRTLKGDEPDIAAGPQCTKPFECPFHAHCNEPAEGYPVAILPRINATRLAAFAQLGLTDVRDIPAGTLANPQHERIRRASIAGKPIFDRAQASVLKELPYPRYFLDFETFNPAVPLWAGTRPYQQIPFQWSLHVQHTARRLEHDEFLDLTGDNPARPALEALIRALGRKGPILVYSDFEKRVLTDMAVLYPDFAPQLHAIVKRLVDLLPITQAAYYHPDMMGSWSIKAVLPTVAPDLSYDDLKGVQDGGGAQLAFEEATAPSTPPERRETLRAQLLAYCERDTLATVRLAARLQGGA